jgi:hypothetical protein
MYTLISGVTEDSLENLRKLVTITVGKPAELKGVLSGGVYVFHIENVNDNDLKALRQNGWIIKTCETL